MSDQPINSVTDFAIAIGADESLVETVEERISSRQIVSTLASMRIANDISQENMAEILDCSQSRISKLENGIDDDLKFRDIRLYANACGRIVYMGYPEEDKSLVDCVKYHAFRISDCLQKICEISTGDPEMERGAVHAHIDTLANTARLIAESVVTLPCFKSELNRIAENVSQPCIEEEPAAPPELSVISEDALSV